MKEIKAYVRANRLEQILQGLQHAGARDMTLIRVDAIGAMADPVAQQMRLVRKFNEAYSSFAKLEIVCGDREAGRLVEVVREGGRTGFSGDGRILVSSVERGVNIRTGAEGEDAL